MEIKPWQVTYRAGETGCVMTRIVCAATFDNAERKARDGVPKSKYDDDWELEKIEQYKEPNADYIVKKRTLLEMIPEEPTGVREIWHDWNEILTKNEDAAEKIADLLEAMGFEEVNTGYYDPDEDERNDEVDDHTGYYYVSF